MTRSDPYAAVDRVIRTWSNAHSLKVFDSFGGRETRFCYVSSSRGECFQISIQPPGDATVKVDVWSVETRDDRELHEDWVVPISRLQDGLEAALSRVRELLDGSATP